MLMNFDIDVSGEDLLSRDYTICISNNKDITRGFKFSSEIINLINYNYSKGIYNKYKPSDKKKTDLKIRIYSIIIYYLFKYLNLNNKIELTICRDFYNKERDIVYNLEFLLINKLRLNLNIEDIYFCKLSPNSLAHKYAYLIRKNKLENLENILVNINIKEIEIFLNK